ncbi:MAG: aromatic ring-hydroxylating dioxygenase subunit alpha [marine benthic group bacterium]|nr:aromatic ring-hydroxylating dioxygenase subunit alpha [Gemmatimonadota bacterium]
MDFDGSFADLGPDLAEMEGLARAETVPSAWFTESRFELLDRAAVIGTTWQYVGHVARIELPGSWLVADVAGEPIVVVRDLEGDVRAFYNVCRHRGGPLASADGCGRVLKCGYHGWTYQLDGRLRGVPHWNLVELFDREDYGLVPIRVSDWQGLLFVNLDADAPPLEDVFGGIAERIAPIRLEDLEFHGRVDYEVKANWKVYVENYLEGYHIPIVHPELMKLYDFSSYETELSEHWSLQHSPLTEEEHIYGAGGRAWYYCVFPNFMLNILPGRLQTNRVVPTGPESCRVEFEYFYADPESERTRERIAADLSFADLVQDEDIEICEQVQRGLASRGYDRGRFSVKYEGGVYHFQNRLRRAYREWLDAERRIELPQTLDPRQEEAE